MQVTQDKKRYPLLNHYRYTFHKLKEKSGSGALAVCAGDVMLSVLLPFLEAALAGAVAACLVSGRRPGEILALVAGYIVLLQVVRFCRAILGNCGRKRSFCSVVLSPSWTGRHCIWTARVWRARRDRRNGRRRCGTYIPAMNRGLRLLPRDFSI